VPEADEGIARAAGFIATRARGRAVSDR